MVSASHPHSAPSSKTGARVRRRVAWAWWLLFGAIAFLYLYFVPYFPSLNNPNENCRGYQIRAAVELHKLSINEQIAQFGMTNDLGVRDGVYYCAKAPGTTLLGIPIYGSLRAWDKLRGHPAASYFRMIYALRLGGTLLPTLLFVLLFRRFVRRFVDEDTIANLLATILALGTMLITYALIYVNHSLTAATAFGTLMATHAAVRARRRAWGRNSLRCWAWLALAGILLASTASLDYALLPVAGLLLLWIPWKYGLRWASTVGVAIGAALPSILTAAYHKACWGGPFKLSTSFLANQQFAANHATGVFGIVGPSWDAAFGVVVSPSKGLLFLMPVLGVGLIASLACPFVSRWRKDALLCCVISVWMLVYAVSLVNWDAGWTVGPRYATCAVPFLVFGMALVWPTLKPAASRVLLPILAALGLVSVMVMTLTSVVFPHIPPDYTNPVYEIIWPLWRDGITPYSFGQRWLGLAHRWDQIPFVIVLGGVLGYLLWASAGSFTRPHAARWLLRAVSVGLCALIVAACLRLGKIPKTVPSTIVEQGSAWMRRAVWWPPLDSSLLPRARPR